MDNNSGGSEWKGCQSRRCGTTMCSWGRKCNCEKDMREEYHKDLVDIEWCRLPGEYHKAGP